MDFILSFGVLFLIIVFISFIVKLFKQPIIVGYVLSGVFFSVFLMKDASQAQNVVILSELGITFLLFLMGLEFDLKSLKFMGKDILMACLIQSVIFFLAAFGLSSLFGFGLMEKVYLSVLFMFGSTLLVAKWVEDKKESNSLHGKIILGTLIIQDIIAILALTVLSVIKENSITRILLAPLEGLVLIFVAFLLSKYLLNPLLKFSSRYPELLFILSLGVCFFFVELASLLGYSTTLGAFIAGITLANTIYRSEVSSRLKPLINFFNMLFFVGLGFQMELSLGANILLYLAAFILLALLLKPVVTYVTLRKRGYDLKTSFMAGIYLAQFSEFGIIIIAGGVAGGAVSGGISAIGIISVIVSMIISSYLIKYDQQIYAFCERHIQKFDKKIVPKVIKGEPEGVECNILLFGYNELNKDIHSRLKSLSKSMVVVENDPENIDLLVKSGIKYIYGTPNNPEFFEDFRFIGLELVISSITDLQTNKNIIKVFKRKDQKITIIVSAKTLKSSIELYEHDADYVIYQTYLHEQQVSALIDDYTDDIGRIVSKKVKDLVSLKEKDVLDRQAHAENSRFIDIDSFFSKISAKDKKKK